MHQSMFVCTYKLSYHNIHPKIILNSHAGCALNLRLLMQLGSQGKSAAAQANLKELSLLGIEYWGTFPT